MNILFITAEDEERDACRKACLESGMPADMVSSGMGAEATHAAMRKMFSSGRKYDYVIDAGIAGSFKGAPSGSAFCIVEERHGEAPDTVYGGASDLFPWLPSARGVTFQTMTSDPDEVRRRTALGADVESMEGAAFFDACHVFGVQRFAELRTISNPVGEDNMSLWDIPVALDALYRNCLKFLEGLK